MLQFHHCGSLMTYSLLTLPFLPPVQLNPHGSRTENFCENLPVSVSSLLKFFQNQAGDKSGQPLHELFGPFFSYFCPSDHFTFFDQWQKHLHLWKLSRYRDRRKIDRPLGEFRDGCNGCFNSNTMETLSPTCPTQPSHQFLWKLASVSVIPTQFSPKPMQVNHQTNFTSLHTLLSFTIDRNIWTYVNSHILR